MPTIRFTQNIQRHVACAEGSVEGATVREALESYFRANQRARGYVLDDQGEVRHHMTIFVDGRPLDDRRAQSDPVVPTSEIFVMQALSGGSRAPEAERRRPRPGGPRAPQTTLARADARRAILRREAALK